MSFCSSSQSLSVFAKPFGSSKRYYTPRISASADVPDFLSADWLEPRRKKPFGPRLCLSAEEAIRNQLEALKYNDQPHPDYGVELILLDLILFKGLPTSGAFLTWFERFRRIFHHSTYRVLLGHQEREILSSLYLNENLFKQRVWVRGTRPEEEEIFQFTMVQILYLLPLQRDTSTLRESSPSFLFKRVGGSWDGYWLTESVLHDGDTFSGVAY